MGNNNSRPVTFRQSQFDFPLTVALGEKSPSWGLSRWGGSSPLRFLPVDDEGFTLRGDRRRLIYKGRRRSHMFTILSDGSFEYDVIFNKEPDNNVVVLPMEGAEKFDFYRQPDFIKDPYLAGSYAVYKKETLIGEGTGKLCHIHRPLIIDARGRRCWGELSVVDNCLCITIPEQWLAVAKFPVVVDPTIGTTTVGSQTPVTFTPSNRANVLYEFAANPFVVPEDFIGMCTAHVYLYDQVNGGEYTPIIFKDFNNKPKNRITNMEQILDCSLTDPKDYRIKYPPQWKTAQFNVPEKINTGSQIWFGGYGNPFSTKFDYGGVLYKNAPELICIREGIGEYYDEADDEWYYDEGDYINGTDFYLNGREMAHDYILSWYFDYTPSSKKYVRTITQGVTLFESKKLNGAYNRTAAQNCTLNDCPKLTINFLRSLLNSITSLEKINKKVSYSRKIEIFVEGKMKTKNKGEYYRENIEIVKPAGLVSHGLLLFVRIITGLYARDYILGRFLRAREEIKLKSIITCDITLDSRII